MSTSSKMLCTAAALALLSATPAFAQGGGGGGGSGGGQGGPPVASTPDRDRDQDRLRDRDQDRDRLYLGTQDRLRDQDRDRDGRISQSEFRTWHEQTFATMDGDNSGGFTLQEFLATRLGPRPRNGYSSTRRQRVEERAQARKTERFRLMDGDGDGVVSRNEYMNFGELNYLDADADDDGRLTFREMQEFHRGW